MPAAKTATPKSKTPSKTKSSTAVKTPSKIKSKGVKTTTRTGSKSTKKSTKVTKVVVYYDVGFGNTVSVRGKGGGLNWDKGVDLKNISADKWSWETTRSFTNLEMKVLINDHTYEIGENHRIKCGDTVEYTPAFDGC